MSQDYTPLGPSTPPITSQEAASRRRFTWRTTLIVGCGGCAVVGALAMVFGGWAVVRLGLGVFADEVEADLRSNPVIVEHIGRIEEFQLDLSASIAAEGHEDFVFRVKGTKGSGLVTATCVTNDDGVEEVTAGSVQLESGELLDLFPAAEIVVPDPG